MTIIADAGDAWDKQHAEEMQQWERYWNSLSPAEQRAEIVSMDRYVAESSLYDRDSES